MSLTLIVNIHHSNERVASFLRENAQQSDIAFFRRVSDCVDIQLKGAPSSAKVWGDSTSTDDREAKKKAFRLIRKARQFDDKENSLAGRKSVIALGSRTYDADLLMGATFSQKCKTLRAKLVKHELVKIKIEDLNNLFKLLVSLKCVPSSKNRYIVIHRKDFNHPLLEDKTREIESLFETDNIYRL